MILPSLALLQPLTTVLSSAMVILLACVEFKTPEVHFMWQGWSAANFSCVSLPAWQS